MSKNKNIKNPKAVLAAEPAPAPAPAPAPQTPDSFPIVGIGASAGGLAAFEAFFSGMPADADPGMAFVLVQHLAPDHKSILTDLVRRYTRMQVFEVEDGMPVHPNCAYIIPPNSDMALLNGTLQLLEPAAPRGQRLPIDFFFRSLAHDQRERAICVVLSGTGSDGTLGARAVKGEGGLVMVQTPDTTEFDGMPRSVIATGLADYELPPAEMPARLIAYAARAGHLAAAAAPAPQNESLLKKIFVLLRAQTGHDFTSYKPSTITRRIERRMAVQQIETMAGYVKFLQATPAEVEALFRDMLIGVTNFFRDPEAFKELEEVALPRLFAGKPAGGVLRVWAPGCSTGEEAYSLAILLVERLEALKVNYSVQVFATDIDAQAIAVARVGLYPASIAADLTPERLSRFFTLEPGGTAFRIHKGIRDMLVFSEQDVIKDPPFSKLDLISCRNLMIYMGSELQKKLIPLFHYALNPDGILFLGTSETVGEFGELFATLDRKAKLYQRKDDLHRAQRLSLGRFLPPLTPQAGAPPRVAGKPAFPVKLPLQELTEAALLAELVPVAALVTAQGDVLYIHGLTGLYLQPMPGEAGINNIVKMAREGLRHPLGLALHKAADTKAPVRTAGVRVKTNGHFTAVNLTVRPVAAAANAAEAPLYLVVLEEAPPAPEPAPAAAGSAQAQPDTDSRIAALQAELRIKEEYLQSANEEQETSNEELKSSNEEMQSVNEELQSTNEELETAKEEMQSVNEELNTVNNELQTKVLDLSRANNDMNNLLAGTGIATVFLDHQLRILRFTTAAAKLINLIPGDVGRPMAHIVSNITNYTVLTEDAQAVLDTLAAKDVEVNTKDGRWYTLRMQPYRTQENTIEGAVLTFIDFTEMKRAQAALDVISTGFKTMFNAAPLGIALMDSLTGHIYEVNPMFAQIAGRTMAELAQVNWMSITHPDDVQADLDNMAQLNAGKTNGFNMEKRYLHHDGTAVWINMTIARMPVEDKAQPRHLCMIEDITGRKRIAEELRKKDADIKATLESLLVGVVTHAADTRIIASNTEAQRILGLTAEQLSGKAAIDPAWAFVAEDLSPVKPEDYPVSRAIAGKKPVAGYTLGIQRPDRDFVTWVTVGALPIFTAEGVLERVVVNFTDITERMRITEDLRVKAERKKKDAA
ncbi:MAG: chemotaxis protein CheB [Elusimicrobiota bacterium]